MLCPIDFYFRKLKNHGVYEKFLTIQKLDSRTGGMNVEMDGKNETDIKMNGGTVIDRSTQGEMDMGVHKRAPLYMEHGENNVNISINQFSKLKGKYIAMTFI